MIRNHKHPVWQLPNGMKFVHAATPSDWRAGMNSLATLRRLLSGITKGASR
jgi:hypothetical protein